ncbi:MAG TPA: SCO family protein [Gaiellaceae bacterium]|nr:SCO family protein [Gaiellaceae bacterium]
MRRPLVIAVAGVAAVAVAVPVTLLAVSSPERQDVRGSRPPARLELPAFSLRDQKGDTVTSDELRGKAVVVTFLDTKCSDSCPVIAEQIRQALARLSPAERAQTVALAVSVQPQDDTPESVHAFLRRHRVEGALRYLIGSEAELRPVWNEFQVLPALDSGSSDIHSAPVRVYDRDGVWISTQNAGADLTPANLAHDVGVALETAG